MMPFLSATQPAILALLLPILDIFSTIEDMSFVIKIMAFAYMLLWLYAQLRESMLLFGMGSMLAGYFLFINPLPTILIVIIFVVFVSLGMHLQMLFQFGLFPLLRFFGVELEHPEVQEQQKMQNLQQKLGRGEDLTNEEEQFLEKVQKRDVMYQQQMHQRMQRYGM
ncbi:MAG: hypothetical protein ABH863_03440 [Candidatus Micrarchaeota archaeon]